LELFKSLKIAKNDKDIIGESCSSLPELEARAFWWSVLTSVESCFSPCGAHASITFESSSQLSRLETAAFSWSGVTSTHRPASVTVISERCPVQTSKVLRFRIAISNI
jgi:hypothetical protein